MDQNLSIETGAGPVDKMNVGLRLGAAVLDHLMFSFAMSFVLAPFMVMSLMKSIEDNRFPEFLPLPMFIAGALSYAAYLNKDLFNARSPGKRIVKTQVFDLKTGLVASPLKCLLRNVTLIFWPMEAIAILINPKRRFGDYLAGTMVDYVERPQPGTGKRGQMLLAVIIAAACCILITLPLYYLGQMMFTHQLQMIENMNNRY